MKSNNKPITLLKIENPLGSNNVNFGQKLTDIIIHVLFSVEQTLVIAQKLQVVEVPSNFY